MFLGTGGMRVAVGSFVTVFESHAWRDAMASLRSGTGVTVAVVDLSSGATLSSAPEIDLCAGVRHGLLEPCAACLATSAEPISAALDHTLLVECELGMPCLVAPIAVGGQVICHVVLTGYVEGSRGRRRVLQRLLGAGAAEDDARAMLDRLPDMKRAQAESIIHLVCSHAELLLRERVLQDSDAAHDAGIGMLSNVAEGLAPGRLYERVPKRALETVVRLAGARGGQVYLVSEETDALEIVAVTGEACGLEAAPERWVACVGHVMETGRSSVVTGWEGDSDPRRVAVLAVPLRRGGTVSGALLVCRSGESVSADDVRVIELFAEIVSAMLDNARDFRDMNNRLVELVQVNEVAQVLNATLDYERLAELAVHVLEKAMDFDAGGFVIDGFGARRGRLVNTVDLSVADLSRLLADVEDAEDDRSRLEGIEVSSRMADLIADGEATADDWTVLTRDLVFRNMRVGALFIASTTPGRFRSQDERILAALADHLSIALENATLYQRLSADFDRTMSAIAAIADANERLEHGHTDRIMDYAVSIAEEMDLPLERVQLVRFSGLLHDLGKVGVSEEILVKPSSLTPDEMERVRRHSDMGASIVEQISILGDITPVVRHHHERFDGTGYPDGLAGADIPVEARILAVADAFESMTHTRAHQKRMPAASARIELERGAGTQFDPEVVAAFSNVLERRISAGATGAYAPLTSEGETRDSLPS